MAAGESGVKALLVIVALLMATPCQAADPWTRGEVAGEVGFLSLLAVDWGQTVRIARSDGLYHENNRVIGRHPSERRVHAYMGAVAVLHVAVMHLLPTDYRRVCIAASSMVEVGVVGKNVTLGLGFGW